MAIDKTPRCTIGDLPTGTGKLSYHGVTPTICTYWAVARVLEDSEPGGEPGSLAWMTAPGEYRIHSDDPCDWHPQAALFDRVKPAQLLAFRLNYGHYHPWSPVWLRDFVRLRLWLAGSIGGWQPTVVTGTEVLDRYAQLWQEQNYRLINETRH